MVKDYIETFDNILPLEVISSFIKYLNFSYKNNWFIDSKVGGGKKDRIDKNIRDVKSYFLTRDSQNLTNVHYHNLLTYVILTYVEKYQQKHSFCSLRYNVNQIECLRYAKGGHYNYHVDGGVGAERTLSSILLLNNDYKGGTLSFLDPVSKEEIKIKVEPNRLIIWPSNFCFPHTVEPITEGIRYSVVAWTN